MMMRLALKIRKEGVLSLLSILLAATFSLETVTGLQVSRYGFPVSITRLICRKLIKTLTLSLILQTVLSTLIDKQHPHNNQCHHNYENHPIKVHFLRLRRDPEEPTTAQRLPNIITFVGNAVSC